MFILKPVRELRSLYAFLAVLAIFLPLNAVNAQDSEGRHFLNQFQSTALPTLDELAAGRPFKDVPQYYVVTAAKVIAKGRSGGEVYLYHPIPYRSRSPVLPVEEQRGEKNRSGVRNWVLFSRCVIRSFYIV